MRSPLDRLSPADYVSALNGLSGFLAISFFVSGAYVKGSLMISLAVLFDGLDGIVARKFGGPHSRGMQVDSLADTISFCVAPAVALYSAYHIPEIGAFSYLSVLASLLFVFLGIVRLSSYSREGYRMSHFRGLPTPSAALMIVSSLLIAGRAGVPVMSWFGISIAIIVSMLMIAPVGYPKPRGALAAMSATVLLLFIAFLSMSFYTGYGLALYGALLVFLSTSAYVIAGPFYCRRRCSPKMI